MKEDVLEQIVVHNVGSKPSPLHSDWDPEKDRVPSDVDVVGYHPRGEGNAKVVVVSCKSWQPGFDADYWLDALRERKKIGKRFAWQFFRELWVPKWADAFRKKICDLTGAREFSYRIAVTLLRGDAEAWSEDPTIGENLPGCSVGFLPLEDIWATLLAELTTRPAASEIGRLVQLLKAAGLTAPEVIAEPSGPAPGSDAAVVEQADAEGTE